MGVVVEVVCTWSERRLLVGRPAAGAETFQDAPVESTHTGNDTADCGCVNLRYKAPFAPVVLAAEVLPVHQDLHEERFKVFLWLPTTSSLLP